MRSILEHALTAKRRLSVFALSIDWIGFEIDRDNYKGRVLALPKREDIQLPVNEQLIVELYSK